ncbi:low-density lipoprotein receptor-related protein 2-like isoform X2 [Anneissia japonica]|nr:low-density lipoprotein receptor-related protein 2-like isoform X2 [Anneissia japonica]
MDFDLVGGHIYCIDYLQNQIMRLMLNGSDPQTIISQDIDEGEGLAIDWVGRKIYWTDGGRKVIDVANLDGSSRKTLIQQNLFEPRGITLDPRNGYLYWSDWGLRPYIGRAGMDGSNPIEFQNDLVGWPNGLTICYATNKLYWVDAHLDHIVYSNLNGSGITILLEEGVGHPFAVTVFEDYLYWTDWNLMTINKANKLSGRQAEVLDTLIQRPFDIHVVHPLRQDATIINPCDVNNGGCSHLCLLTPSNIQGVTNFSCACPNNFELKSDGKNCEAQCTNQQFKCADNDKCIPFYWKCDGEGDCRDGSDENITCSYRSCMSGLFQCDNGECTFPAFLCDGDNDCGDNSDENHCSTTECSPWEFRCDNGQCINQQDVCQLEAHCADGSDEHANTCSNNNCSLGYFQCANGYCIPDAWFCDLDDDCGDSSDEPPDQCQTVTCAPGWFPCSDSYRCIPEYAVCDGNYNCRIDISDEQSSLCESRTCSSDEFRCYNNRCIPLRWQCDSDNDCGDRSDEVGCSPRNCSESEFKCMSGLCIPWHYVCDLDFDCFFGEDEQMCNTTACDEGNFRCMTGHCIIGAYKCDGYVDCFGGEDEINCGPVDCEDYEFRCTNTDICIPQTFTCDGDNDCGDESDEQDCDKCPTDKFMCSSSGLCIHTILMCNGFEDCVDGSDETDKSCTPLPEMCESDEFKCENLRCIPVTYVCDTFDDCNDNTDEYGCHKNSTCASEAAKCEQICTDIDGGFACSCGDGFILRKDDKMSCADYNECDDNPCHQVCVNTKGNYTCRCASGYVDASSDGTDCKPESGDEYLIYTDGPYINQYYFQKQEIYQFVSNQQRIEDLDYDLTVNKLYWIDSGSITLKRANLSGDNPSRVQVINATLFRPRGLACDWVAGNIYWTDWGDPMTLATRRRRALGFNPSITVANRDGNYPRILIDTYLEKPFSIVVNPRKGLMYWVDQGEFPKIEAAWMNGENREELVTRDLIEPTGLTIDFANYDTVYFADQKEDLIYSMNFDGSNVKRIKGGVLLSPYHLEVFGNKLYWSTSSLKDVGKILSSPKLNNEINTTVNNIVRHSALKMYNLNRYPDSPNPCLNSGCSHLCLIVPFDSGVYNFSGYQCRCGEDYGSTDGYTCLQGVSECDSNPCQNDGTCSRTTTGGYSCLCPFDFDGKNCENAIDNCFSNPCINGGLCQNTNTGFRCLCLRSYTGERCETEADLCRPATNPCLNNGTCIRTATRYRCICAPGYFGFICRNFTGSTPGSTMKPMLTTNTKGNTNTNKNNENSDVVPILATFLVLAAVVILVCCFLLLMSMRKQKKLNMTPAVSYRMGSDQLTLDTVPISNDAENIGVENPTFMVTGGAVSTEVDDDIKKVPIDDLEEYVGIPPLKATEPEKFPPSYS